jgi:hypothetical protein
MSVVFDVPTISVLVASASVIIGAIYYMLETRHQSRVRQTENVIRLSPWFSMSAKEIQETINLVCSVKYTSTEEYFEKYSGKPEQTSLKLLGNYLEGIGVLVHRKLVEADLIYDFWGDIALSTWEDNEKIIHAMRERSGEPRMFEYWEQLSKEMRRRKETAVIIKK